MLLITRRIGESFTIGDDIEVRLLGIRQHVASIGIQAPRSVRILRKELHDRPPKTRERLHHDEPEETRDVTG